MPKFTVDPAEVVKKYKAIAVVGASKNPEKDAYTVPEYLQQHGYTVIPVNPTAESINGLKTYPSLSAIPDELAKKIEVVDVFRPSEELPQVAKQVVELKRRTGMPLVFWGQEGLENEEAKKILSDAKIDYVMDRCMRIEHRLMENSR
jgi:predicted CoA-binding protein